jgi:hypothetical protein
MAVKNTAIFIFTYCQISNSPDSTPFFYVTKCDFFMNSDEVSMI